MSAEIISLAQSAGKASVSETLSTKLRNIADSLEGLVEGEPLALKTAVIVLECQNGELVALDVGFDDWARTTGILFGAAQQVSRGI